MDSFVCALLKYILGDGVISYSSSLNMTDVARKTGQKPGVKQILTVVICCTKAFPFNKHILTPSALNCFDLNVFTLLSLLTYRN